MAEESLLQRLRLGHPDALEKALRTFGPRLLGFIQRMTGDRSAAEDLTQDVFVKLMRHAPRLPESANLSAWLFTVARNQTLNYLRDRQAERRRPSILPAKTEDAHEHASRREVAEAVQQAMQELEEPFRSTFELCAIQGLDYESAAQILGCPRKTVNTRMFRAWEKIRRLIRPLISDSKP